MLVRFLIPAVAAVTVAAAQSASICSQPTATINSQADATQYASCSTISGSVLIGPGAPTTLTLNGPQQITGDLICHDAGDLTSLSSTSLGAIGGTFDLNNLTRLSVLQFDGLTASKNIKFITLPNLSQFTFTSVISKSTNVQISNTFLNSLDGIDLKTVSSLQIDNNVRLSKFDTQIGNISTSVIIAANSQDLVVSFPNLIWAANITFRNVSSIKIPSLTVVNGTLGFYGNYIDSISAPNLTSVGNFATGQGSLAIVDNLLLQNISMPLLKSVGGADQVANNTILSAISFPALASVGGAIDFSGNFSTPQLPALNNVKGGFNIQSKTAIDCSGFDKQKGNIIQGVYVCKTSANVGGLGSGTSTGTGSSASPTKTKNAAISYGVNEAVAGLSVIGGLLQMLL